jgi:hypothetical protein
VVVGVVFELVEVVGGVYFNVIVDGTVKFI